MSCNEQTVTTRYGRPVCDRCRVGRSKARTTPPKPRICWRCQSPDVHTTQGIAVCDGCRIVTSSTNRKRQLKHCRECQRPYTTTSGAETCNACLYQATKHPCADCGEPTHPKCERCMRCARARQKGEHHPHWNGGRTVTARGYVKIQRPEHPRAQAGYVLEHMIVVEERIGRYLLPGETVHHINGVKGDNRDENLELWVKSQPAGQRAEDLVSWAREIIARYAPEEG